MSSCSKFYEGLNRRLDEGLSIDQIANELCNDVSKKREKIIKSIKVERGGDYLIQNAEQLGFNVSKIRNTVGLTNLEPSKYQGRLNKPSLATQRPKKEQYIKWEKQLLQMVDCLENMNEEWDNTTEARHIWKLNALCKRTKEMRMILLNRVG